MRYVVTINNKSYEVEVEKGQATVLKVEEATAQSAMLAAAQTAAAAQAAPAVPQPAAPASTAAPAAVSGNGQAVKAPMPGTILSVKVKTGQAVKRGDLLFILEAMKMENEIFAPVDGVIAQIAVNAGTSVSTGDALAIIQ